MRERKAGFTLVELLVVITIIVLLLSLLAPAMEKAIYQAEMALCGGNLRATATSVTSYAFDYKRSYPYRSGVNSGDDIIDWWPDQLRDPRDNGVHDDRPELKDYLEVNKFLNCPLVRDVDLTNNGSAGTVVILANYEMYWNWGYRRSTTVHPPPGGRPGPGPGMMKMGDRWETDDGDPNGGKRYRMNLLACDVEYDNFNNNNAWSSHPDKKAVLAEVPWQNYGDPAAGNPDPNALSNAALGGAIAYADPNISMTWSRWEVRAGTADPAQATWVRGLLDRNFAYTDGAVIRLNDIGIKLRDPDPRMLFTSQNADAYNNLHNKHVPKP